MKHVTYLECMFHTLAIASDLDEFGPEFTEIEGGHMGGLQKRRSVLNIRKSPQIDETCYIPRMYVQ
jgi:hypothetical protein